MKTIPYILVLVLLISACTEGFKEMNTDKTGISDEDMQIDYNILGVPMGIIQQGIYFNYDYGKGKNWPYQIMQNLSADMFCGYMHDYKPFNGGSHNSDYNLQDGWNSSMWENTYAFILPQVKKLEDLTAGPYPQFYGVTKILKVMLMHRITDYYGPIIYTQFGNDEASYLPDTQEKAYSTFFTDLDTAINCLNNYLVHQTEMIGFPDFDYLLDGHFSSWIKLANSLRLRLALRIATADPEKAKMEACKALSNEYGVFEDSKEVVAVSTEKGYINPLGEINNSWGEAYMNANMESILTGYHDPRLEAYFKPCTQNVITETDTIHLKGKFKGIRQGTLFAHTNYLTHSRLTVTQTTPAILMTAAEIWFLRAEASLRGWTSENTEECYQRGITNSCSQWNVPLGMYLLTDHYASDYEDAFTPEFSIKARCQVSPKWDASADRETKLEKIITQKWIALFPEGCEAWAEQRRTGYPRLFPVKYNNSPNHCIDTETMIRRLSFPAKLQDTNPRLYQFLRKQLNGPDHAGTRLWWDTGKNWN